MIMNHKIWLKNGTWLKKYNLIMKNTKDHKTLTLKPTKSRPIRPKNQIFLLKSVATQ